MLIKFKCIFSAHLLKQYFKGNYFHFGVVSSVWLSHQERLGCIYNKSELELIPMFIFECPELQMGLPKWFSNKYLIVCFLRVLSVERVNFEPVVKSCL